MSCGLNENLILKFKKVVQRLDGAKQITITTHANPDGDAIGSALALFHYVELFKNHVKMIIHNDVPHNFKFLSGSENFEKYNSELHDNFILQSDLLIIVDLNDPNRTKSPSEIIKKTNAFKIVIDHHFAPELFADLSIIETDACSAGELIYKLVKSDDSKTMNRNIAEALYAAILTDTGSFRFPRTDGETHRIIADIIDRGADPVYLYENIYNIRPFKSVKLLGEAFANLELYYDGTLCLMALSKGHFQRSGASEEDVEDIVENFLTIKGVKIGVLLSESLTNDEIRISFRSKDDISIREIALKFNGGGHKHAAGARVYNTPLKDVKSKIIEAVSEVL